MSGIAGQQDAAGDGVDVTIVADVAQSFTFASYQNAVPVLRALELHHAAEEELSGCMLELSANPPFLRRKTWAIDRLMPGDTLAIADRRVDLDPAYLAGLDEAERGELSFVLRHGERVVAQAQHDVRLLARHEWGGVPDMAQLLPAFVMPNDPALAKPLRAASELLAKHGFQAGLDGYQSSDPARAEMLAAALYSVVAALGIHYAEPPASFERRGQKVRRPTDVLASGFATCLDSALFLAAMFEEAGLNPILLLFEGHAGAGVWLRRRTLPEAVVSDPMEVRKAIAARELMVFETTGLTRQPAIGVKQAHAALAARLEESREGEFRAAIDVRRLREGGIKPLATHVTPPADAPTGGDLTGGTQPPEFPPLPNPQPVAPEPPPIEQKPTTPDGRIERWQKKLLDLSLRNRLLNFRDTKKTVPFLCTDVAFLEDRLAEGAGIRLISLPEQNPLGERDAGMFRDMRGHDVHRAFAADALARNELPSPLAPGELEARLIDLYRQVKNDVAEGGTNTLFLAVGFLRWRETGGGKDHRAPLLLLPVKLERMAATARFTLRFHEDEARFNATLLKFLEQEFELLLPQFEGPLPTDDSGIDVPRLLAEVRRAVRDVPGMEVLDETALSTFSFAKYLMWKDLVDRTELLRRNRVVRHLIDTPDAPFPGTGQPAPEERDIDRAYVPSDVVSLLPADSSQIVASLMAAEGHDMVIVGPPGTGKSQTIANMIGHCLAVGKTVLFVAEKSAALSVVYRRLREHGLGPHCLELHSSKADRKSFLSQLKASWEHGGGADDTEWLAANGRLKLKRDELNAYVDALHRVHPNGLSVYEALGRVLKAGAMEAPAVAWAGPDAHDADGRRRLEGLAEELGRTFAAVGAQPALRLVGAQTWSNLWQQGLLSAAGRLRAEADGLARALDDMVHALGLAPRPDAPIGEIDRFAGFTAAMEACAGEDHAILFDPDLDQLSPSLADLRETIASARQAEATLAGQFARAEIPRIPVEQMEQDWRTASAAMWPLSVAKQAQVRRLLATYAVAGARPEPQAALPALRRMQDCLARVAGSALAGKPLGFAGMDSDVAAMAARIERAAALRAAFFALRLSETEKAAVSAAMDPVVTGGGDPYRLRTAGRAFADARAAFAVAAAACADAAGCSLAHLVGERPLATLAAELEAMVAARSALADWTSWRGLRHMAELQGLAPLVAALEAGALAPADAGASFRQAYAAWWLPLALDADPVLRGFRRFQHEHAVADFRALDDLVRSHAAARVRRRLAHGLPAVQSVPRNSELGLLRHQMELQRPSKSIREMIGAMPQQFGKLAPCMLMSPLSIAQYLPAGHALFDVVIFDEASQITTWDAVGAIARGRQTVIVGDPKQLPPTNFFGRSDDEEEVEEHQRDLESILDEARASGLPVRYLSWHYRSRRESLIAFSNQHYYGNRLITFPSPEVDDRAVALRHVADGVYDRGSSRTNIVEARALAAEAVSRMRAALALPEKARPTLGIITFNLPQQELIQNLLDKARQDEPEIEWFFSEDRYEPTIVKNLENVQGDERDVILFSITFTRDAAGVRRMDFGALNRDGGERRLNVAVTRARQELVVFSGTRADDIDLGRTKALGASHLKAFLDFAARGAVALAAQDRGSEGGYESPFEQAVAEALGARGWQVVTQVGVSGFRVDLAIKHPERAGRFLAGVECDGATYHRSATARDRDKVREEVLRGLGWEILRVWSTDWWRDSGEALARLDVALNALLDRSRAAEAEPAAATHWALGEAVDPVEPPTESTSVPSGDASVLPDGDEASGDLVEHQVEEDEKAEEEDDLAASLLRSVSTDGDPGTGVIVADRMAEPVPGQPVYRIADLNGFAADPGLFFEESYTPRLAAMVEAVLAAEAPLREDILAQRIARAHGWLRTGTRIKAQIARHLTHVERISETSGDFIWLPGTMCGRLPFRYTSGSQRRGIDEIPIAELAFLASAHPALLKERDPPLALARRIGIDRLGSAARMRLHLGIARAAQQ
ncbi:DUF3320 domain-containing protein [Xanthobacter autotrophicus]|uniref:DUF3320 domain-containing protein n=1 Tax=Xanthobacter autotrophicus TaxID=280 RepID=UPI0037290092